MMVLPPFEGAELQSSVTFLPKKVVDVRSVEVIQGLRFTGNKIERFGFSIPRNKVPSTLLPLPTLYPHHNSPS